MRVLHIEGDQDISVIVNLALSQDHEIELTQCASAAEAKELEASVAPDVILADFRGPMRRENEDLDPSDQSHWQSAKTVYLTAVAEKKAVQDLMDRGAAGVISKPFDPMMLAGDIRAIVGAE